MESLWFIFYSVTFMHKLDIIKSVRIRLVEIFLSYTITQYYTNPSAFDRVITKIRRVNFFETKFCVKLGFFSELKMYYPMGSAISDMLFVKLTRLRFLHYTP